MNPICYVQRVKKPRDLVPNGTQSLRGYYAVEQTHENKDKIREEYKASLDALNALIPLDYMGSAEFEFGAVPQSLRRIAQEGKSYVKFEHTLRGTPRAGWGFNGTVPPSEEKTAPLYGWCKPEDIEQIKAFFEAQAKDDMNRNYRLKERSGVQDGCFGVFTYDRFGGGKSTSRTVVERTEITGWYDITNDWFVSKDKYQATQLAYLLGVPIVHD